jgi:hypothetical protein
MSSRGLWVPVHDEEWDGDVPSGIDGAKMSSSSHEIDSGITTYITAGSGDLRGESLGMRHEPI